MLVNKTHQKRKEKGLCPLCGNQMDRDGYRCASCIDTRRTRNQERVKANICIKCGFRNPTKNKICPTCLKENRDGHKKRRSEYREKGLCIQCGKNKVDGSKSTCKPCIKKARKLKLKRDSHRRKYNLCLRCGKKAILILSDNSKFGNVNRGFLIPRMKEPLCETHWFRTRSRDTFNGKERYWEELKEKLIKQDYKCAYTGRSLIIGFNASIDHTIPKSKGGSNTIDNVKWVDLEVNLLKYNMLENEFLAFCREVVEHNG